MKTKNKTHLLCTQILLNAAHETLWEPEGAWQSFSDKRIACNQVVFVTSQDQSPGPAPCQHCVCTKTAACPARRPGDSPTWRPHATEAGTALTQLNVLWNNCKRTSSGFVFCFVFFFLSFFIFIHFRTPMTLLSKLHCNIYANTDLAS